MTSSSVQSSEDDIASVAVIGMACRFPAAESVEEFWELLREGGDAHEEVPDDELHRAKARGRRTDHPGWVGVRKRFEDVSLFDAGFFGMTPAEAAITDPQQRFLLETAVHALEDAAIDPVAFAGDIGVFVGMNHSEYLLRNVLSRRDAIDRVGWHRTLMGNDRGFTATQLSYRLGLTGPSVAVDCACSSSLAAVYQGCRALLDFEADAVIAGGAAIKVDDVGYIYEEGGIGSPDGRCRPFSAHARGTIFGSGAGLVVLRRLEDAVADGDRVLAVIRAGAMNNDGDRKSSYTAPSVVGQAELIAGVHALAGVSASEISYVEAHGTATLLGDPIEMEALAEAFRASGGRRGSCHVGSVKANIGHLDSASGVAGLIKVVLALRNRIIPPTPGADPTNPHIDFDGSPFRVATKLTEWVAPKLIAGVSSFGVGGTNVHMLVEEARPVSVEPMPVTSGILLPFSAKTPAALGAAETRLRARLKGVTPESVRDVAHTLRRSRTGHPLRRALLWCPDGRLITLQADLAPAIAVVGADDAVAAVRASGVRPAAVMSGPASRRAGAMLAGVLRNDGHQEVAYPADVPWYDEQGSEFCADGWTPALTELLAGAPAVPGRRTIPPRASVVLRFGTGEAETTRVFGSAPVLAGPECMLALAGFAWVSGLADTVGDVADGPARIVDVPRYQFTRDRHWVAPAEAVPAGQPAEPAVLAGEPAEERARRLFREVLGIDEVELDTDFLDLGGDSLLALRVVARAREQWRVHVPLGSFLAEPTPRGFARLVRELDPARPAETAPPASGPLPLTPLQERFYFLAQLPGASEAYHVPVLADLRGRLEPERLRAAFEELVRRHESLRLSFRMTSGGPVQEVAEHVVADLPVVDIPDEAALRVSLRELLDSPIDLGLPGPFRARLFRLSPTRHVFAAVVHHICADARSSGLLLRDLYACYAQRAADLPPVAGLFGQQVVETMSWLGSADAARQLEYWTETLAGAPETLELPTDTPRAAEPTFRGDTVHFSMSAGVVDRIKDVAKAHAVTPFAVVLAAFTVFLSRVSGKTDVVVGVPIAGRHRPHITQLIGNFVNTLPLRLNVDTGKSFRALIDHSADRQRQALDHQDVPFELIAKALRGKRDLATAPVCQVLFNMLDFDEGRAPAPEGLEVHQVPFDITGSAVDLQLDWSWSPRGGMGGRLTYNTDLFTRDTVTAWQDLFTALLEAFLARPDAPLRTIPSQAAGDDAMIGRGVAVPARTAHGVFVAKAEEHPDRLAVTDGTVELTYRELARLSAGIADQLVAKGVRTGESVAIAMPRGVPLVCAVLGVQRAGATPAPLDLNHPERRLAAILRDTGAKVVVTDGNPPEYAASLLCLDLTDLSGIPGRDGGVIGDDVDLEVGAYLTYTSGTTGGPKGIHFPHRALTQLVHWETEGFGHALRFLQLASFGFDAAFHEMFAALCSGGSLHVAVDAVKHDHDLLVGFLRSQRVEKAILPVSLLHALAARGDRDGDALHSLQYLASTGEQLRVSESLVAFFERLPDCTLINNYGPAETHVVTSHRFAGAPRDWRRYAPIGKPVDNVLLRIVDSDGLDVPRGSVGELLIGGPFVATGYLNRPELTAQRFSTDLTGVRWYASGDRCRLLASGEIELLGRADQQVKIRGFRVEPGEIEVVIRRDPDVRDVALAVNGPSGDRRLDAYLAVSADSDDVVRRVRAAIKHELPGFMMPASFTVVPALPLNANGKVDVAMLPTPRETGKALVATGDAIVDQVTEIFRDVLANPAFGPHDDFFDAGGHSLLATRLVHVIREDLRVGLTVAEFYRHSTPAELTATVLDRAEPVTPAVDEALPAAGSSIRLPPGLRWLTSDSVAPRQKTFVYEVARRIDPERLRAALDDAVRTHAALRLGLDDSDATTPVLGLTGRRAALDVFEAPGNAEDLANWLYQVTHETPLDPRRDALVRFGLIHDGPGRTLLAVTVHLAALDGRGLTTLLASVADRLRGNGGANAEDLGYPRFLRWRDELVDSPRATDLRRRWCELARAEEPPVTTPYKTGDVSDVWSPDATLRETVRARCSAHRVTPFVWHLTAFVMALTAARGTDDVCVALPFDGRVSRELDGTVGGFANVLPLRVTVRPASTPADVLATVAEAIVALEELRALPFADLAASDPRLAPFTDLPVTFHYVRPVREPVLFDGARLRSVGPDLLVPGQRLKFTVVDGPASFTASLRSVVASDSALLTHHRQAVYALAFEHSRNLGAGS